MRSLVDNYQEKLFMTVTIFFINTLIAISRQSERNMCCGTEK